MKKMIRLSPSHLLNFHDSLMWKSLLYIWKMRNFRYIQKRESPFHKLGNTECQSLPWGAGLEEEDEEPRSHHWSRRRILEQPGWAVPGWFLKAAWGETQTKGRERKFRDAKSVTEKRFCSTVALFWIRQ